LGKLGSKESKTHKLLAELSVVNVNLPARVTVPLYHDLPHHVVRIPPQAAAVLNSKDRAPYILYVEVLLVEDVATAPLQGKLINALRHTKSEENIFNDSPFSLSLG